MWRHYGLMYVFAAVMVFSTSGSGVAATTAVPESTPTYTSLKDARAIIAEAQAIPPGGIDELRTVELGSIKQWIHVRGDNPDNPILLFIHGGPGSPMMPESWAWQRSWEAYFTIVQWDQRGAGKTFATAGMKPDSSMTVAVMQSDAEELITWLRRTYKKKKIFVMAHSWGSILGIKIAQAHPDWLYAYIGVGQVVNAQENEVVGFNETLARAKALGNAAAVKELEALKPYPSVSGPTPIAKVIVERKWDVALGGMIHGKTTADTDAISMLSPDYTEVDFAAMPKGELSSVQILLPQIQSVNFDRVTKFHCPVFIFAGAEDRTTPEVLAKRYFDSITAPKKKFFKIARAAHYVVSEVPGEVLVNLVRFVRPLARDGQAH